MYDFYINRDRMEEMVTDLLGPKDIRYLWIVYYVLPYFPE